MRMVARAAMAGLVLVAMGCTKAEWDAAWRPNPDLNAALLGAAIVANQTNQSYYTPPVYYAPQPSLYVSPPPALGNPLLPLYATGLSARQACLAAGVHGGC